MPVQKFRSVEDLGRAPILPTRGEGFERFVRHCARYRVLARPLYPRGVFRFHTIDEAQAARARVSVLATARQRHEL